MMAALVSVFKSERGETRTWWKEKWKTRKALEAEKLAEIGEIKPIFKHYRQGGTRNDVVRKLIIKPGR